MILSFYERKDSPWVWVQYALNPGDPKRYQKTNIPKDSPHKRTKKARYRAALEERMVAEAGTGGGLDPQGEHGWAWVLPWIGARYQGRTAQVYRAQWRTLAAYLFELDIAAPLLLERRHCYEFLAWRTAARKQKSGRNPRANTAIGELKLLAQVMDEARARRLFMGDNPVRKLGLARESTKSKPEITDPELDQIFAALAARPPWMQRSFQLALRTGLRFAETRLHRSQVDWAGQLIHIEEPKGGRKRAFSIPVYQGVRTLLLDWWQSSDSWFWTAPPGTMTGLEWTRFFRAIKLPHLCFHCTRVTFISRGARAGISEGMMMKLVNHASAEVHRIYQRLPPGDAAAMVEKISIPSPAAAAAR